MAWCLLALAVCASHAQEPVDDERLLKAVFVYNFAKFTRWPPSTWDSPHAPLNLCIDGSDELGGALRRLEGETIRGRPVVVRDHAGEDEDWHCHVLYIAGSEHQRFAALVHEHRTQPQLTVSEVRGFADAGGMIQLFRAGDRIRFRINLESVRVAGLHLSARLLDLAELADGERVP